MGPQPTLHRSVGTQVAETPVLVVVLVPPVAVVVARAGIPMAEPAPRMVVRAG